MLSVSQKQSMLDKVKSEITARENYISFHLKPNMKHFYQLADKDSQDQRSFIAFKELNLLRDEFREHKQKIAYLANMSKQLKNEIRRNKELLPNKCQ